MLNDSCAEAIRMADRGGATHSGMRLRSLSACVLVTVLFPLASHGANGDFGACGSGRSLTAAIPDYVCISENGQVRAYDGCEEGPNAFENGMMSISMVRILKPTLINNPPARVSFDAACANHDACYGTYGANKRDCDQRFRSDLEGACESSLPSEKPGKLIARNACIALARKYAGAVEKMGCDAFKGAQSSVGDNNASCDTLNLNGDPRLLNYALPYALSATPYPPPNYSFVRVHSDARDAYGNAPKFPAPVYPYKYKYTPNPELYKYEYK